MAKRRFSAPVVILLALLGCLPPGCKKAPELLVVADFGSRQCTGVAVASDGRVFVNFPRWSRGHDVSVVEVLPEGATRAYPSEQWNRWGDGDDPRRRFVCVQSVHIDTSDPAGALWVLDAGNPRFEGVVPNAPKLVKVDLATNRVVRIIRFDSRIAPPSSYLNDVRVDGRRGFAYITDSGLGALIVVDLNVNRSRRVLDGHASTRAEAGVVPVIGGRELRGPDGKAPRIHADGVALSPDGEQLYFKALTGRKLYRVAASKLRNFSIPDSVLAASVEMLGEAPVCDGMVVDGDGRLYLTALAEDAVVRRGTDGASETVIADARLAWPDSLAISTEGDLYITVSRIHLLPKFNDGADRSKGGYKLLKLPAAAAPRQ